MIHESTGQAFYQDRYGFKRRGRYTTCLECGLTGVIKFDWPPGPHQADCPKCKRLTDWRAS